MTYSSEVRLLAAQLHAYDTMDEDFGYVRDEVQEQYLERALFVTVSPWAKQHDQRIIAEAREVTDAMIKKAARVIWVSEQEDKVWAESVFDDMYSPADDLSGEAFDLHCRAKAILEAALA